MDEKRRERNGRVGASRTMYGTVVGIALLKRGVCAYSVRHVLRSRKQHIARLGRRGMSRAPPLPRPLLTQLGAAGQEAHSSDADDVSSNEFDRVSDHGRLLNCSSLPSVTMASERRAVTQPDEQLGRRAAGRWGTMTKSRQIGDTNDLQIGDSLFPATPFKSPSLFHPRHAASAGIA